MKSYERDWNFSSSAGFADFSFANSFVSAVSPVIAPNYIVSITVLGTTTIVTFDFSPS
jgi:hypothetical protein